MALAVEKEEAVSEAKQALEALRKDLGLDPLDPKQAVGTAVKRNSLDKKYESSLLAVVGGLGDLEGDRDQIVDWINPALSLEALRDLVKDFDLRYRKQRVLGVEFSSAIQAARGNIQVCCRIRPLNKRELGLGETEGLVRTDETKLLITKHSKEFGFDQVWPASVSQDEVFESVEMVAIAIANGNNASIIACESAVPSPLPPTLVLGLLLFSYRLCTSLWPYPNTIIANLTCQLNSWAVGCGCARMLRIHRRSNGHWKDLYHGGRPGQQAHETRHLLPDLRPALCAPGLGEEARHDRKLRREAQYDGGLQRRGRPRPFPPLPTAI